MKRAIPGIEFLLVRLLTALVSSLPEQSALGVGALMGRIALSLMRARVKVVKRNLELCSVRFESKYRERLFILRCFQHIGVTAVEVLRQKTCSGQGILGKVTMKGTECLGRALNLGRGAILMSGHYGNWELLGAYVCNLGFPVDLLVKRQSNVRVDEFIASMRNSQGVGLIYTDTGLRDLVSAVKAGRFVAILADQYGGAESVPANFMGAEALVPAGPADLIKKYNLPLVIGFMRRALNGHNYITIRLLEDLGRLPRNEIVQSYTLQLEEAVKDAPELWLWTHRKFKNLTDYHGSVR